MTPAEYDAQPAIERLRNLTSRFGWVREGFNHRFTVEQLLALDRAWMLSEWDISPDEWGERQVQEALRGKVPDWTHDEKPVYGEGRDRTRDQPRPGDGDPGEP